MAHAFALATGILWIVCSVIVWLFPSFSLQVTSWWMHGMDMSVMGGWNLSFGNFVWGGVTAVASAWGTGWVLVWSWEMVERSS